MKPVTDRVLSKSYLQKRYLSILFSSFEKFLESQFVMFMTKSRSLFHIFTEPLHHHSSVTSIGCL